MWTLMRTISVKGTCSRLVKFVYNFFLKTQTLYISSMKPSLNFKLIVHGIEPCATFEERENKQKNAKS